MEKDTKQNNPTSQNVRKRFDQTLAQHIERLIGPRHGPGSLPFNFSTISCIILLNEREKEIDSYTSNLPERYTHETLLSELAEIGLDPGDDLKMKLQDMIQKGYIDVKDNGGFFAKKPTINLAELLDRIFPKMPGMNFIAYFVQTMDEAQSGRKVLDSAISQLNQMLQMQGVSLLKQKSNPKPKKIPIQPIKRQAKPGKTEPRHASPPGPKVISSNGNLGQVEIREIFADQDKPLEKSGDMNEATKAQETEIPEEAKEIGVEPASDMQDLFKDKITTETSFENTAPANEDSAYISESTGKETKIVEVNEPLQQEEAKHETEIVLKEDSLEKADDVIEKQISALEEDLAMQCPMCKNGTIQLERTVTNKIYYKCSNKNCNFISWGKPHHIVCPQCQNPFLVETFNRDGKPILKCPRATCRYWQRLPGKITEEQYEKVALPHQEPAESAVISKKPRKRVVRRRVVRRKR